MNGAGFTCIVQTNVTQLSTLNKRTNVATIQAKDTQIVLRTTESRKSAYREQAAADGMRLSEWIRRLADRRLAEVAAARAGVATW